MRTAPDTVDGLLVDLRHDRHRPLARLLTVVEAGEPALLRKIFSGLRGRTGRARVTGMTGPPGVGKSALTSALVTELCTRGRTVAVLAVDPSSPLSGGALLGDRIRMADHAGDPEVFIRSMAARGHLGGLASAAAHAIAVLDAAGFDDVVVETVGVGQSEFEIVDAADCTVVVLAPGLGDAVQAAKAGLLEIADVFVVNKADLPGADRTVSELRGMLRLGTADVPVARTVAARGEGTADLGDLLDRHFQRLDKSGGRDGRRRRRAFVQIRDIVLGRVAQRIDALGGPEIDRLLDAVATATVDPWTAADTVLATAVPERG